jgi:signal transduction histidine kinase
MAQFGVSALRDLVRRPLVQDAALAAGLLAVCLPVNDPVAAVHAISTYAPGVVSGPGVVWGWWLATALTAATVTLRRRWPLPALVAGTAATTVHLTLITLPMVVDLAVLLLLGTVAARCARPVSLGALGVLVLLAGVWCLPYASAGRPVAGLPVFNVHFGGPGAQPAAADSHVTLWGGPVLLAAVFGAAWAIGSAARNRRAYLDQLQARAADLERERDQRAALAVAAERGRISREVHDVVAHGLSLIVIQAQGADAALDHRPADTRGALRTIVRTGRDSLTDMRRMLDALGEVEDTWHPQPGLDALPSLLDRVRQAGTPVSLRVDGTVTTLPAPVDLSAYRVVQEALTNVVKHAGPGARADVVVRYSDTRLGIHVTDDGRGRSADSDGGNGLRGMDSRVRLLGGRLDTGPGPDGGFLIRAELPIDGRA